MTDTDLRAPLLAWAARARRDLPWRRTRDPWAILVSELMLQQTQVARVIPRYETFLTRFPTVASCADARAAEVIELWDGLGYNRRALHLHAAAKAIAVDHEGEVPPTLEELLRLPGVGPYTARAVLVFAFEQDHGVLDTNVARFLSRAVAARRLGRAEAQGLADELVPSGAAWEWNQGLLDLGASICTKRAPTCAACPVEERCRWRGRGNPAPDPADGSAGASGPQARFEGSDRQGRGRIVAALRAGPVRVDEAPTVAGWSEDVARTRRVVAALVEDGLVEQRGGSLHLPGT